MYTTHYGLTAKPFSIVPDPNILFLSKNHENALTYLEYGLSEKVGFILLTGEVGIGKTTLIRYMTNKMSSQMDIAVIFNTNFSSDQLFRRILSEFELPCDTADKSLHLETLYHFLIEQFARGRHTLLVIDEAQNLADEVLEDIRMLFNLQTDNHILLQIILVGQTDLKRRMGSPNLRQLAQRIVVNYHLSPLTSKQTYEYINFRLKAAGATTDLFTPEAMALIYEKSGGIPRTINLLCDAGLVYGYAENKTQIDREIIESVLKDRICLTTVTQDLPLPSEAQAPSEAPPIGLVERIAAVEDALAILQNEQMTFLGEIRSELDQNRQLVQALQTAPPENAQPHAIEEQETVTTAAAFDDPSAAFTFKDSGAAHPLKFEDQRYAHEATPPPPDHRFEPVLAALRPSLGKTFRKRILPYLDMGYTWIRSTLSLRYAIWAVILIVPLATLWAMTGSKETPAVRHAHQAMDSEPQTELINMNVEDESPSMKASFNNRQPTPIENEKKVIIHTIQSGDTLLSIARHYGVSAIAIKEENKLQNSHLIYIGQTLKIPSSAPNKN
jgi:general secretion pathway protein A